ncbi:Putative microtubule binding protein ytm1 [Caligus rogercresseyi]|uniref:WD repeat-containing protein 37 n=1 Tax=Caligus rogercresseyi TaxID=217165 RepID=A0A7T8K8W9_CALRO|nr:Putative microtubule binding protein ytm1 [Caligus rogercresseyi]QQP50470.1 Putative microtubule binding protein ytm1 [Caligus rogercresseyi]
MPKNRRGFKGSWYSGSEERALPVSMRSNLHHLFGQIEKEFEQLYRENRSLSRKVEQLSKARGDPEHHHHHPHQETPSSPPHPSEGPAFEESPVDYVDGKGSSKLEDKLNSSTGKAPYSHKIKSQTNKLRAQTTWIMSNLKNPSPLTTSYVRRYVGHSDGIWDVDVCGQSGSLFGTASADHTARIWDLSTGVLVNNYVGHSGSVNSLSFHPSNNLVLTASGDGSAHIWRCAGSFQPASSTEFEFVSFPDKELGSPLEKEDVVEGGGGVSIVKTPLQCLAPSEKVMTCAAWFKERIVTVGWEGYVRVWDVLRGTETSITEEKLVELTHVSAHPTERLFVVSGKDSNFRVYDDRGSPYGLTFSGHTDTVTSAFMTRSDQIVSGSDDRTVKIWDKRDHRSPLTTIQMDSPVNTLALSPSGVIAVPQDNRQVRFYDLTGQNLGRLPRNPRQCHNRMVCSAVWTTHAEDKPNLLTCGFDMVTYGWSVLPRECKESQEGSNAAHHPSGNAPNLPPSSSHKTGKD